MCVPHRILDFRPNGGPRCSQLGVDFAEMDQATCGKRIVHCSETVRSDAEKRIFTPPERSKKEVFANSNRVPHDPVAGHRRWPFGEDSSNAGTIGGYQGRSRRRKFLSNGAQRGRTVIAWRETLTSTPFHHRLDGSNFAVGASPSGKNMRHLLIDGNPVLSATGKTAKTTKFNSIRGTSAIRCKKRKLTVVDNHTPAGQYRIDQHPCSSGNETVAPVVTAAQRIVECLAANEPRLHPNRSINNEFAAMMMYREEVIV